MAFILTSSVELHEQYSEAEKLQRKTTEITSCGNLPVNSDEMILLAQGLFSPLAMQQNGSGLQCVVTLAMSSNHIESKYETSCVGNWVSSPSCIFNQRLELWSK